LFTYVGAEVTFGGWISTFMIKIRGGETAKMGYVTTGFWAGLTVGRMSLGFLAGYFEGHEEWLTVTLQVMSLIMLALIWAINDLVLSAICTGFYGFFIGPLFPTVVVVAVRKLPKNLHVSGVGFSAALGGGGAAILPFLNGVIAQHYGPKVIGPLCVSLMSAMLLAWLVQMKFF
jgi:fucose permease